MRKCAESWMVEPNSKDSSVGNGHMRKRREVVYVHAALALLGFVALALATTWVLVAIGEGTSTIKLHESGAEFAFGGTFGLFLGLVALFVKTFKKLITILSSIIMLMIGFKIAGAVAIFEKSLKNVSANAPDSEAAQTAAEYFSMVASTIKAIFAGDVFKIESFVDFTMRLTIGCAIISILVWWVFSRWRATYDFHA
jgi:hypothetical protein